MYTTTVTILCWQVMQSPNTNRVGQNCKKYLWSKNTYAFIKAQQNERVSLHTMHTDALLSHCSSLLENQLGTNARDPEAK